MKVRRLGELFDQEDGFISRELLGKHEGFNIQ